MTYSDTYSQYDYFMGRWSRRVAALFLKNIDTKTGLNWLDVGCGVGTLTQIISEKYSPSTMIGIDPLETSIQAAKNHPHHTDIQFELGNAQNLPFEDLSFDAVVSGLMIKFVTDKAKAISEMKRVTRVGGIVALYDWDMASNMNTTRHFWSAVEDTTPVDQSTSTTTGTPIAEANTLKNYFEESGLNNVQQKTLSFTTCFRDLDDYWKPITTNSQNVGRFYKKMSDEHRNAVYEKLKETLPFKKDGSIQFESRAIMAQGYA